MPTRTRALSARSEQSGDRRARPAGRRYDRLLRCANTEALMTTIGSDLENLLVTERELWEDGPPHELFKRLRNECPVHWTARITEYPAEHGYWSVTTADDVHAVSRDWQTY